MKKTLGLGILAGVVMLILGFAVMYLFGAIFPSTAAEYENLNIFRAMDDPLMSIFYVYPFILGIVLAFVWNKSKSLFKGTTGKRAVNFGLTYWLVASLPGMVITYASFQLSFLLVFTWLMLGLLYGIIAGLVFAKYNK